VVAPRMLAAFRIATEPDELHRLSVSALLGHRFSCLPDPSRVRSVRSGI
jgi:hypothetical protein